MKNVINLDTIDIVRNLDTTMVNLDIPTRTKNDTVKKASGIKDTKVLEQIRTAQYDLQQFRSNATKGRRLLSENGHHIENGRGYDVKGSPETAILHLLSDAQLYEVQKVEVITGVLMTVLKAFVDHNTQR